MNQREADSAMVLLRLSCFVRQEEDYWVSGCPSLDVYSQAHDAESAKAALHEAVELWIESCVERNTLNQALTELGWHRFAPQGQIPSGSDMIGITPLESAEEILGEPFPIQIEIPAFQAARLMDSSQRATR